MPSPRNPAGVVHLTAEYWPFAQTGGLGQAVAGLAAHQARSGLPTTVIVPLYRDVRRSGAALERVGEPLAVTMGALREELQVWRLAVADGEPCVMFLDHAAAFDREGLYGEAGSDYADNARRFGLFSLAALEWVARLGGAAPVVHAHDWHAAFAPVYLRTTHAGRAEYDRLPCVLSVHNAGFQGHFARDTLAVLGLPDWLWSLDRMEWYDRLNLLKGGLLYADMCTTVSPTHAVELRTEVGGFGLHDVFTGLGDRFVGIRNGIDEMVWNPAADGQITARFTADDLGGKVKCKAALQRGWGLPQRAATPVFGMSARLVTQKGFDIILESASLATTDAQFVFLGSGEERYHDALAALAAAHPDRIAVNFGFTDRLEHRVLAGADFLLMPSLYEPCGLTQMRAQLYGALPLARRVGGLADTITDGVTGILFDGYTPADFDRAVARAVAVFRDGPVWREHVRAAMRRSFSWDEPAAQYCDLYRRALAEH